MGVIRLLRANSWGVTLRWFCRGAYQKDTDGWDLFSWIGGGFILQLLHCTCISFGKMRMCVISLTRLDRHIASPCYSFVALVSFWSSLEKWEWVGSVFLDISLIGTRKSSSPRNNLASSWSASFIVCRESQNEPFAFSLGLKTYGNEEMVLIRSMQEKKRHRLSVRD